MLTETLFVKLPPLGVSTGAATADGAATVSAKAAAFFRLPAVAVTVIGKLPVGVDADVTILSAATQLGLQDGADRFAVAPEGRPETAKLTCWALPEFSVAVTFAEPLLPAVTAISPEIERL